MRKLRWSCKGRAVSTPCKCLYLRASDLLWWSFYREGAENMYYFSSLALTLNEFEEGVAPTDSRRRPDQRLMEDGRWDEANAEKQRLEEKQRTTRREREREAVKAASSPEEGKKKKKKKSFGVYLLVLCFCPMFFCSFIFCPLCLSWNTLSACLCLNPKLSQRSQSMIHPWKASTLLSVFSHPWSSLYILNLAKTHVQYVCVCIRKVLNFFYIILQTLNSPFTIPSSISVLFSWCRRDWHRSKWGFWWKQVSLQSST